MTYRIDLHANRRKNYARVLLVSAIAASLTLGEAWIESVEANPAANRGYSLLRRGWVNDAIAAFQQAVRQSPRSLEARLGLAIAYQRAGQDVNAWEAYQQVLEIDAQNRAALEAIGLLGGYRSQWQSRGIEALTTLLELNPQDRAARTQRALLLGYQGRFAESLADYELLLANNPSAAVLAGAAEVFVYSGDYARALQLFGQHRAMRGSLSESAAIAYARALQETGDPPQAIQLLEGRLRQTRSLNATAINLRAALAQAYQANQQTEAALEALAPLEGRPEAALPLARTWSAIARQTQKVDLYEQAVRLYQQVLRGTTQPSVGFLTEVADVLSELPATQPEALRFYEQLARENPQTVSFAVKRLAVARELGQLNPESFRQEVLKTLQTLPESAAEQRAIAQVFVRLDPPDAALLPIYQNLATSAEIPFLNFRVAQIYLQQSNLTEARRALAAYRATPAGSRDLAPELLLAEIERRSGNLDRGVQIYETLIAKNPPRPVLNDALQGLAGIRLMQGNLEQAIAVYDRLIAQNPQDLRFQLGRSSLAYQVGQMTAEAAEATLNEWLSDRPVTDTPPELFSLMGALPANAKYLSLYERLVALKPDDFAIQRRLIQVMASQAPEQAKNRVNTLIAQHPNEPTVYFIQAELAQALGDLNSAGQAYERVLAQQPNNVGALSGLGGVRFQQRQFAEANALFSRVLEIQPDDLETERVLAELSLAQSRPLEALARFRALQQQQQIAGAADPLIQQRIRETQVNLLRQRGFQPYWERF